MKLDRERVGTLVVRIWLEAADGQLRARITRTFDVEHGESEESVAATVDDICDVVRAWATQFASGG